MLLNCNSVDVKAEERLLCLCVILYDCVVVSGSIAHTFPEYTEREHVFALSTAFGDAYLMQVGCAGVKLILKA